MYADREEATGAAGSKSTVRERLNGGYGESLTRRLNVTRKRQRQDEDKWEHDLFNSNDTRVSSSKTGNQDLRLKLQRKSLQSSIQNRHVSNSGGGRDLREKLSGTMHSQPLNNNLPKPKVGSALRPVKKVVDAAHETETENVAKPPSKKKIDAAIDKFLQSLGLEKYVISQLRVREHLLTVSNRHQTVTSQTVTQMCFIIFLIVNAFRFPSPTSSSLHQD